MAAFSRFDLYLGVTLSTQVQLKEFMNIVLIEDSALIREQLCGLLLNLTDVHVVGHADNEEGALNLIHDLAPDLVLLDISLREGNGINILRRLKNEVAPSSVKNCPLVAMLSNKPDHYRSVTAALGADAYFDKSMQIEEALHQIQCWADDPSHQSNLGRHWSFDSLTDQVTV
ncbi:MAG: response regulator [Herminiimonas sp.]|uniref:response regulator n=1 Tax=Herminiimonas sp. TaxID=1926289 RepID=UPI002723C0B3|nr:response regulator [Herminiimonas sp.]MDO9420105.1 response regulator [Herminiimonas sp.]